jgi:DNA-binding MarR family transcriptional regulator
VLRQLDREDRRVVRVLLSAKGREVALEACGFRRQKARQLLRQFESRELEALLTVLAAAQRSLSGEPLAKLSGQ